MLFLCLIEKVTNNKNGETKSNKQNNKNRVMKMKKKERIGFPSQVYEAPRAVSVTVTQESILCASPTQGAETTDYNVADPINW